ncbi:MAG: prephenate dehydrogenase/arogenate dehydrogenase family protein [Actinobacteria bacterium]|nr:MAG: prephenate dehydrogenase/arogenate dehydrogenase family protein [Actinomycetota bacterium]
MSKKVVIHGTGLMGASIGLGLVDAGWEVFGWDPDPAAVAMSLKRGAISRALESPTADLDNADVLVLAGPPSATIDSLGDLDTDAVVTDIASVKRPVVEAGAGLRRFVPGHPMAGSASSGADHASAHLFHGATWVLCDDTAGKEDIDLVKGMVSNLGASPVVMSSAEHDERVALVSHLPRLLASVLIEMAEQNPEALHLSAGSFRDLTRVAGSEAGWWTDVFMANQKAMAVTINQLQGLLERWKLDIAAGDRASINDRLEQTREARAGFGPSVAAVRVILYDRPGEIGLVGRALEQSEVDLRDLQIRHAEYGGGGVLTLSVAAAEAAALKKALADNGFEIEE